MITRRTFTASSLAAIAFAGLARRSWAQAGETSYRNEVPGYGALVEDPAGLLDLPPGFSYSILSSAGEVMDDGYFAPECFDGMACFPLDASRVALVRNHELQAGMIDIGPTGGRAALLQRLRGEPHYGRDADGRVLPGGTSTIVYDLAARRREQQYLSLAGTVVNCAGGPTPWGSWLSCEENIAKDGAVAEAHGWVFDVPARHRGLVQPVPLRGLGRFRHEAAAVDPATGIVYLTEDQNDSLFYRFIPARPGDLQSPGRLQALALRDLAGADTRNWETVTLASPVDCPPSTSFSGAKSPPRLKQTAHVSCRESSRHAVRWIDMADVESPEDDLRGRGHAAGAAIFARGEGIHRGAGDYYFCCTSGGSARLGQIFRYLPSPQEGRPDEAQAPGQLELFVESADPKLLDYADNITVAPWGHLIACEDRSDGEPCHLKGVTPEGKLYTLARLNWSTELAGACFSPDGATMFVNVYRPGRTLAITGPWHQVRAA